MGLAAPKNRRKLGNDPNNTKWSRNTDSFGHRMLRAQGWEPGQFLGPQDSAHAVFHTAASASHIRVALKEDNLGLGAKVSRGDECTGLSAFKEMLARLNGKSEAAIQKDKKAKEDHMRSLYVERKFGSIRFVSGGFLVGDKIQESTKVRKKEKSKDEEGQAATESSESSQDDVAVAKPKTEKQSKKRKAEDVEDEAGPKEERRSEKKKKRRRENPEAAAETQHDDSNAELSKARRKTERKEKKEKSKRKEKGHASAAKGAAGKESREKTGRGEKKKDKKKRQKDDAKPVSATEKGSSGDEASRESTVAPTTGTSTPVDSGTSTPVSQVSARYLARRRFIAQKRMALNDQQALNQIFMIKSA